jgi:hypothetical protein
VLKLKGVTIPKEEVLRYLGYKKQEIEESLDKLINETIEESKDLLLPKFVYGSYKNKLQDNGVLLEGTNLVFQGKDIKEHLKYSNEVVVMAVTVGSKIETKIKFYEKSNLTKALILDACATTAVEEVCDEIEEHIKMEANSNNLSITFRYSPGYGDLPLDIQGELISVLKADKTIGLTASAHHLLFPRKSVTAIIGLTPMGQEQKERGCETCKNYETCGFRREGIVCGS